MHQNKFILTLHSSQSLCLFWLLYSYVSLMHLCLASLGLMCELLWSDPQPLPGRGPSKRGVGLSFGADVTKRFLQDNNIGMFSIDLLLYLFFNSWLLTPYHFTDLVVRSHEVKDEGYEIEHDGKLITVFSAPNYCDQVVKSPYFFFNTIYFPMKFMEFAYLIVSEILMG